MKIYSHGQKIEEPLPSIALGNFDGMHKGHIEVINAAKGCGKSFGALLFRAHSSEVLGDKVKIITPLEKKIEMLEKLGADFVYLVDFNEEFMNMSCAQFAGYINNIGAEFVSVGYDFRCGKGAKADADELRAELSEYGIKLIVSKPVTRNGEAIKSTLIRNLLSEGKVSEANEMLFAGYSMRGRVVRGFRNGHLLGFPTANIEVPSRALILKDGVYCGKCVIDGITYPSMVNIGKNPTFDAEKRTVEVHIINFSGDLYDEFLEIEFVDYLRPDKRFDSLDELIVQLGKDREEALSRFENEV